jgi:hypothetical protein
MGGEVLRKRPRMRVITRFQGPKGQYEYEERMETIKN